MGDSYKGEQIVLNVACINDDVFIEQRGGNSVLSFTESEKKIIRDFHRLYYYKIVFTHLVVWNGVPMVKFPMDLWIYQEIVFGSKPDVIIETGTWVGGSAVYLADLCRIFGRGRVVTIDKDPNHVSVPIKRDNLTYITGDSSDNEIKDCVVKNIGSEDRVMVILDSDHSKEHVLKELNLWAPLVTKGCALIVEDTNINGHPVCEVYGPGPKEALDEWLPNHPEFEVNKECEKYAVTFNPGGYLERIN